MKCLWCDLETTCDKESATDTVKFANKEHIFPEAVGGQKTLEIGKVCQDCNKRLGDKVDRFLKTENYMMLKQYQDSSEIVGRPIGKIRSKNDRARKEKEQTELNGYSGGFKIVRDPQNSNVIKMSNLPSGSSGDFEYNPKFSKALHKCAVNILLDERGYDYFKKNHEDLIDFVNNPEGESYNAWSYATCYANFSSSVHFEPFCLQMIETEGVVHAVVLIFPCAIFIVCTKPNTIEVNLLNIIGSNPPKLKNWIKEGFDYLKHFESIMGGSRKTFGEKLKFTLIKNEIVGEPNPADSFYLLNRCKVCGQTNPTGILLGKELVLGQVTGLSSGNKNSWNYHSIEDLNILVPGIKISDSMSNDFESKYGINYPQEKSVKNLKISNCKYQCLNCGELNTYDAVDCFI
jgi:hypothetical protein